MSEITTEPSKGTDNPSFEMAEQDEDGVVRKRRPSKLEAHESSPGSVLNGDLPGARKKRNGNIVSKVIEGGRNALLKFLIQNKVIVKNLLIFALFAGYNVYVGLAVAYNVRHEIEVDWCDGLGFLIVLTAIVYWSLFYYLILKGWFGTQINENVIKPLARVWKTIFSYRWTGTIVGLAAVVALVAFVLLDILVYDDSPNASKRLVSAAGGLVLILIILLMSKHPGEVQWRQVIGGLGLQFVFAICVLRWEGGRNFLECISRKVTTFLSFADRGSSFIYDFAASGNITILGHNFPEHLNLTGIPLYLLVPTTFAFTSLSVIFFFSFVVQLLYHLGAMLWVVRKVGWLLQILIGTSAAESMNAAANIFLGQTEAPLLIKPFMDDLTKSELHAVMTGGFATIAGTVMAAYISFGVKAESLLSASVMAAPCALALSKLMYPEIEESRTTVKHIKGVNTKTEGNALDAAAKGAVEGVTLVWCILANILAFVSFVALLNAILGWFGMLVGIDDFTFEYLLGKLFIPVALLLGVDVDEAGDVGKLLGLKIVVNEFLAYSELQTLVRQGALSNRSVRLTEYALCGFANLSSMGIQLGGLGALAPKRRPELAKIVWRALVTGATASLINACVAGTLLSFDEDIITDAVNSTTISSLII